MRVRCWLGTAALITAVSFATPGWAAMSAEAVAARLAEAYGVSVLRIEPTTVDGRSAYNVTIMNPGGDFNEAFQVNTVVVDAETGDLVSQFRHLPSGQRLSGARTWDTSRQGVDVLSAGAVRR